MPADEQQTRVLPATGDQPVPSDEQPVEPDSPGARWATGATEPPASKETTTDLEPAAVEPDQPTAFAAQPAPVRDLPAGVDPGDLTSEPAGSARRGKLRRRLRYLRHVRELLLRDLGGFTYEIHRTAGGAPQEGHRRLAEAKAKRIAALDAEVGTIEARLGEPHAGTVLREEGIGGTCPECGELHASDARFCARCGTPLDARARAERDASIAAAAQPTPEPQPASVLWAGGPRPASPREDEEKEQPSVVTSQWLLGRDEPTPADAEPAPADSPAADTDDAATSDPGAADPSTAGESDEPAAAGEPAASDEAATDEPATGPSATASQADAGDDEPRQRPFEPGPNGDAPSPHRLTSRRGEQAP